MLHIVTCNEPAGAPIEGYITEVLHREFQPFDAQTTTTTTTPTTVTESNEANNQQQAGDAVVMQPPAAPPLVTRHDETMMPNAPNVSFQNDHQQPSAAAAANPLANYACTPIKTMPGNISLNRPTNASSASMSAKPQVIKLQPFVPTQPQQQQQQTQQQQQQQLQQQPAQCIGNPNKSIIYVPQHSPIKPQQQPTPPNAIVNGKQLIKLGNLNQSTMPTCVQLPSGAEQQAQYVLTNEGLQPLHTSHLQQQQQQQQHQQHQQPQVLNLVLVTDEANGGVSYLSLVPQN